MRSLFIDMPGDVRRFFTGLLQILISGFHVLFTVFIIQGGMPQIPITPSPSHIWLVSSAALSFLFSGFLIDKSTSLNRLQFLINIILLPPIALYLLVPQYILLYAFIIAIAAPLSLQIALNVLIVQSTSLNRGRSLIITIWALVGIFGVIAGLIFLFNDAYLIFGPLLLGITVFWGIWQKKYAIHPQVYQYQLLSQHGQLKSALKGKRLGEEAPSDEIKFNIHLSELSHNWMEILRQTRVLPVIIEAVLILGVLGVMLNILPDTSSEGDFSILFWVVFLGATTVGGFFIDFVGRKPVLLIYVTMLTIQCVLFDIMDISLYSIMWFSTLPFTIAFTFLHLVCIVGDLTLHFRRGRIISIMLFCGLIGYIIGFQTVENFLEIEITPAIAVLTSDILSLVMIGAFLISGLIPETIHKGNLQWRKHLQGILILTKAGLLIFSQDFKNLGTRPYDWDLASGGIVGIQSLIKEISHSKRNLVILDHEDRKLLFSHGVFTTGVLFVSENLPIYQEKLQQFTLAFEYNNADTLRNFKGNLTPWKNIDEDLAFYFDWKRN